MIAGTIPIMTMLRRIMFEPASFWRHRNFLDADVYVIASEKQLNGDIRVSYIFTLQGNHAHILSHVMEMTITKKNLINWIRVS